MGLKSISDLKIKQIWGVKIRPIMGLKSSKLTEALAKIKVKIRPIMGLKFPFIYIPHIIFWC